MTTSAVNQQAPAACYRGTNADGNDGNARIFFGPDARMDEQAALGWLRIHALAHRVRRSARSPRPGVLHVAPKA